MSSKNYILCHFILEIYQILCHKFTMHVILYIIMKFKNYILCHNLYIILITNFQYLTKFIYKSNVL